MSTFSKFQILDFSYVIFHLRFLSTFKLRPILITASIGGTSLARIFARDILLYYSYVGSYEALAQKLFWCLSCQHGVERRRPLPWSVVNGRPRPIIGVNGLLNEHCFLHGKKKNADQDERG